MRPQDHAQATRTPRTKPCSWQHMLTGIWVVGIARTDALERMARQAVNQMGMSAHVTAVGDAPSTSAGKGAGATAAPAGVAPEPSAGSVSDAAPAACGTASTFDGGGESTGKSALRSHTAPNQPRIVPPTQYSTCLMASGANETTGTRAHCSSVRPVQAMGKGGAFERKRVSVGSVAGAQSVASFGLDLLHQRAEARGLNGIVNPRGGLTRTAAEALQEEVCASAARAHAYGDGTRACTHMARAPGRARIWRGHQGGIAGL